MKFSLVGKEISNCFTGCLQDPVGMNLSSDKWQDVNVVISLLKLFFRKLPESLVTAGKYCTQLGLSRLSWMHGRVLNAH